MDIELLIKRACSASLNFNPVESVSLCPFLVLQSDIVCNDGNKENPLNPMFPVSPILIIVCLEIHLYCKVSKCLIILVGQIEPKVTLFLQLNI